MQYHKNADCTRVNKTKKYKQKSAYKKSRFNERYNTLWDGDVQ